MFMIHLRIALALFGLLSGAAMAKDTVLIVLSGESKITLNKDKSGKFETTHATGFFLSELMVPAKEILDAGYDVTVATPYGTKPVMDAVSDDAFWFGGDESSYRSYRALCEELGLCGKGGVGTAETKSFDLILAQGLHHYAAVFLPGGHAPMEDLYKDKRLGAILRYFHENRKPTALICHAPIALLSTLQEPGKFGDLLSQLSTSNGDKSKNIQEQLAQLSDNWIYRGYQMTSFSTKEEQQEEPGGADNVLGGYVKFYPDEALDYAGGQSAGACSKVAKQRCPRS
jgi:putative intracellular protease/amidase